MTNYPAYACKAKLIRPWVPSWDMLPMVLATGSSRLTFMTWTDIASTQWDTSRVDPIEEPDYNNDREFFQEEGLQGSFEIHLSDEIGMEVDNEREVDEEGADEVQNIQDLQLLERLRLGRDSEDDIPPSDFAGYVDIADSDDEDYDLANPDYDDYF